MPDFQLDDEISRENAAANFLKLFYPYHYNVGMAVEKNLCGEGLDRHQAIILWIIHSKGEDGKRLPRKVIERLIGEWYEVGSSYISKSLRKMAAPSLGLIEIQESPQSGREKIVSLTASGEEMIAEMKHRATTFIGTIVDHLSEEEIVQGMQFMAKVSAVSEE